ncbi:MAG: hypothetical protein M3252_07565 [Actinomycetota bacterium]|nr:hypothetical protein [Actinomycetota bacterium]
MSTGVAYFGNRILRHIVSDMEDLASRGFTGVLHTFSENDLAYYQGTMERIVASSHDAGLEVQLDPWGVGLVFGGEAESRFTAEHPEFGQVLGDGRRVAAACLNRPEFRAFLRSWADAATGGGADRLFWDEPHWAGPGVLGVERGGWGCLCELCEAGFRERFGGPMPRARTPEVEAFRQTSMVSFLTDLVEYSSSLGVPSTLCLTPGEGGPKDWDTLAAIPGLDTLAASPYWARSGQSASGYVGRVAREVRQLADAHQLRTQLWIQGFGLGPVDIGDIHAAVQAGRQAGMDELWAWGYEACAHMDALGTVEPETVWAALTAALTTYGSEPSEAPPRRR